MPRNGPPTGGTHGGPGGPPRGSGPGGQAPPPHSPPHTQQQAPTDPGWDIVGGPGRPPELPNPADYAPGGRFYGLVSRDTAIRHYNHALDAYQNGYWYHGNANNYTQSQYQHNNHYSGPSNGGVPLVNPAAVAQFTANQGWHYEFRNGQWTQVSDGGYGGGSGAPGEPGPSGYGGGAPGSSGGYGANISGLTGDQRSAFDAMYSLLDQFGLSELAPMLRNMILDGVTDAASVQLQLQQTDTWKRRFAGNEMLKQKGLAVLSPAEYLATERSYAQIMRNYGLPQGFYDEPADFAKWIGGNVSAAELQQRVAAYSDLATREDPQIVAQLKSMGVGQGDLLAYMMDPGRAAPLIQRQYQTALLGGAARRAGLGGSDVNNNYLSQLAGRGVSEQQASQGYGLIAGSLADARTLSGVYGVDYGLHDLETEVFDNNAAAGQKRKRLASQERAAFSGQSGQSGVTKNTAGSY